DALHFLDCRLDVGIGLYLVDVLGGSAFRHFLGDAFRLADGPSSRYGLFGNFALVLGGWKGKEAAAVTGGEATVSDQLLEIGGKLEEAGEVDDGGPILARAAPDFFSSQVEFLSHAAEGHGRLDRIQVFTLDILDEDRKSTRL